MSRNRSDAYRRLLDDLDRRLPPEAMVDRMTTFVDLAWSRLRETEVSWLGFYMLVPDDPESLILGPRRDRPACSPIGLHGVCGQSLRSGLTRVVDDVLALGSDYVACDPRDRAEIVIPLSSGTPGPHPADMVLDLDSFESDSFSDDDDIGLRACLEKAGFRPVGGPRALGTVSQS
ncbi:MAG: hypothetical protein GY895_17200 [Phycisphaera sp.]|nr:hypothetical protein [Phycisphaera sp.]